MVICILDTEQAGLLSASYIHTGDSEGGAPCCHQPHRRYGWLDGMRRRDSGGWQCRCIPPGSPSLRYGGEHAHFEGQSRSFGIYLLPGPRPTGGLSLEGKLVAGRAGG